MKKPKGLFARISEADRSGKPLRLRPGDVMQLANLLAEVGIERQSQFENFSSFGNLKRRRNGRLPASR